tara:strand:- start:1408 stop:1542 length:135 start_codon:yes stop_codon:yes gene_type:complete
MNSLKQRFTRKFNHRSTEASADILVATLILSGWFACFAAYIATA